MLVAGIWAGIAPRSFARLVAFPYHEHSLHDLGAFQVGIGATLLLALVWRDAPTVALSGFLTANTLQAVSHAIDLIQAAVPVICMPSARCRCWSPPPWCCGCASVAPPRRCRTASSRSRDEGACCRAIGGLDHSGARLSGWQH
jgi:hypothetical protein